MIVEYKVIPKPNESNQWLVERIIDRHGDVTTDHPFSGTLSDCYAFIKLKEMGLM
jgi:hypothetical protein